MLVDQAVEVGMGCPEWCVMRDSDNHSVIWHVSHGRVVRLNGPAEPARDGAGRSEMLDVRAARYAMDGEDFVADCGAVSEPVVELAHYVAGRYRVVRLTPAKARELATILCASADDADGDGVRHENGRSVRSHGERVSR